MPKKKKQFDSIRRRIRNVSLQEFESLITSYGYIEVRGKHPKAIIGVSTLPYRRENPVKACYVKELIEITEGLRAEGPKESGNGDGNKERPGILR